MNNPNRTSPVASSALFGAMVALMATCREPVGKWVKTKPTLLHTKNLFGPPEEIAGKTLRLIERNNQGDCLCVFDGKAGTNIVDVDHRDIAPNAKLTDRRETTYGNQNQKDQAN